MIAEYVSGHDFEDILREAHVDGLEEDDITDLWTAIEKFDRHRKMCDSDEADRKNVLLLPSVVAAPPQP